MKIYVILLTIGILYLFSTLKPNPNYPVASGIVGITTEKEAECSVWRRCD